MRGWYKLDGSAAHRLCETIASFTSPKNRMQRVDMLLFCYSQTITNGKPCPYFRLGQKTLAKECSVTVGTARKFLEAMESQGWFVRVGKPDKDGSVKRTFWWLAEDADSVQEGTEGSVPRSTEGGMRTWEKGTEGSVLTPCEKYAHQSAEHSERAVRSTADAGAHAQEPYPEADYNIDLMPVTNRCDADA